MMYMMYELKYYKKQRDFFIKRRKFICMSFLELCVSYYHLLSLIIKSIEILKRLIYEHSLWDFIYSSSHLSYV